MIVMMAALSFLVQAFLVQLIFVDGVSMAHTLQDGEAVISIRPWMDGGLRRGDVVICRFPEEEKYRFFPLSSLDFFWHQLYVKRLVALPGDRLEIRDGMLYVNGEEEMPPSRLGSLPRDMPEIILKQNEYFVMGDNRLISHDSRAQDVGPLPRDMIVGKVRYVIWPFDAIRKVE